MELRQQLKLSQQLVMTPQLQLAIRLLQMSRLELLETIQQEIEQNPVLEETSGQSDSASTRNETENDAAETGEAPLKEVEIKENIPDEIDWQNFDEYNPHGRMGANFEKKSDTLGFESFTSRAETLQDHLLWQLLTFNLSDAEKEIGSLIIGNLNADGYLKTSVENLSKMAGEDLAVVEKVLRLMQSCDPVGICARDLKECLQLQIDRLGIDNPLVIEIIENHLGLLENRKVQQICRQAHVSKSAVRDAVAIIQSLEPKPGRRFSDNTPRHIIPDIYLYKMDGEFVILQNDSGLPRLHINSIYKSQGTGNRNPSDKDKAYIQDKVRSATWLIRSIHQRQKTIYRVMESIVKFQRAFFEHGITHLKPLVLRDVADDIEMHESTVSRVTSNKYAHTPQGIFELKYFFSSAINQTHGEALSSVSVKDKVRIIIENENHKKPFSDQKIAAILQKSDIKIARRTVAKYREMLNILPSSKRKPIM